MTATAEKIVTITGANRLVSNVSPHSSEEGNLVELVDAFVDRAQRIRKRPGTETVGGAAASSVKAIHEYIYVNPTTGVETQYVMRAFGTSIERLTAGVWAAMALPVALTAGNAPQFLNAENRCYYCNGEDALLVLDGAVGTWAAVGVAAPTITPTYTLGGTYSTGSVAADKGDPTVFGSVGAIWGIWTARPIFINGARYTISTVDHAGGAIAGTVTVVNGNPTITGAGTTFTSLFVGQRLTIAGTDVIIASILNDLSLDITVPWPGVGAAGLAVTAGPVLTLTEDFKEASATGMSYSIYSGLMEWIEAPVYAYSYYNPTTGHVSNRSPLMEITQKSQFGVTPTLTIAGDASHTTAYNAGYTRIVVYRTQKDAGVLTAISVTITSNLVPNRNDGLAITFTETVNTYLDTHLSFYDAPLGNAKPVSRIASIAYWQGRIWGITKAGKLNFSALPEEINDFGVAHYSWPAKYERNITRPRNLIVVGGRSEDQQQLVIQTAGGDFGMAGYNNRTYTTFGLGNRMSGTFLHGSTAADGSLVTHYSDRRLLADGRDDLGLPIQDKLNASLAAYLSNARVHWYANGRWNVIPVAITTSGTLNDKTLVYDVDEQAWYEWGLGIGAFATIHDVNAATPSAGALELWGVGNTNVYRLLAPVWRDGSAVVDFQPYLTTGIIRPFGSEADAQLDYVKVYASQGTNLPTLTVFTSEQSNPAALDGTAITPALRVVDHRQQGAQGRELAWSPAKAHRKVSNAFQFKLTFPGVNADYYIDKIVIGFTPVVPRQGV